jgi:hypothetical protein
MGLFSKLAGHADINSQSDLVKPFLSENETIVAAFKFFRDELIITSKGIFYIDVQGFTGSKKEYKYFPLKSLKYISFESAGTFDMDADIKIGIDGNTKYLNNVPYNAPIEVKIPKAQAEEGKKFFMMVKSIIDGDN